MYKYTMDHVFAGEKVCADLLYIICSDNGVTRNGKKQVDLGQSDYKRELVNGISV